MKTSPVVHLGRGSSGRRVSLLEFVMRQRKRTRARLAVINRKKPRFRKPNFPQNRALVKETWKRGRRECGPKFMRSNRHVRTLKSFRLRRPAVQNNKLKTIATAIVSDLKKIENEVPSPSVERNSSGKRSLFFRFLYDYWNRSSLLWN